MTFKEWCLDIAECAVVYRFCVALCLRIIILASDANTINRFCAIHCILESVLTASIAVCISGYLENYTKMPFAGITITVLIAFIGWREIQKWITKILSTKVDGIK